MSMIPKPFANHFYSTTQYGGLFNPKKGFDNGIAPYLLGDKGFLLLF
jgi:hypothetical protein